jgi:hypothetical protein
MQRRDHCSASASRASKAGFSSSPRSPSPSPSPAEALTGVGTGAACGHAAGPAKEQHSVYAAGQGQALSASMGTRIHRGTQGQARRRAFLQTTERRLMSSWSSSFFRKSETPSPWRLAVAATAFLRQTSPRINARRTHAHARACAHTRRHVTPRAMHSVQAPASARGNERGGAEPTAGYSSYGLARLGCESCRKGGGEGYPYGREPATQHQCLGSRHCTTHGKVASAARNGQR